MNDLVLPVGCFYGSDRTTFCLWAPLKQKVSLILEDQIFAMAKNELGYWSTSLPNVRPGDTYVFALDDEKKLPDPASMFQQSVHGKSIVVDRSYQWTDQEWKGMPLAEMIIYELHTGTFTTSGTFEGVISKLDYLKSLGINAIELMPVAQFPGSRNWGYDGVYPFAVQDSYGGVTGLKDLVNACHHRGIAVILDVVYNHLGPEGNYFEEYGPYFTDKYKTGWGKAINFDDAYCDGVRNYYWQNALMWLKEFHIDGLRLDAVHAIWDFSAKHFIEELKAKVSDVEEETGATKVLIAEFDLNNPRYINPVSKGGYALDGQWIDEFHHALHAIVTGETDGYYEDFGDLSHLAKSYQDSYVYTGQYSKHRKKNFGVKPKNPYGQFIVFAQNHDQIGNRLFGDRLSQTLSFEQLKLIAASYLLSPHVPMLFMGEEYGEKNPFQYFISHTDEKLVALVREGRKKEFSYFGWKEEIPDPQSEETFGKCKLSWSYDRDAQSAKILEYYKHLIEFRKTRKAMKGTDRNCLQPIPSKDKTICFTRSYEDDIVFIALNFSESESEFIPPSKNKLRKIFNSASMKWNGPVSADEASLRLMPYSVSIFDSAK